jgi:hypothetical protein
MHRLACFSVAAACLLATPLCATPPSPPVPLEVRLAKMDVIVVGLLNVHGDGENRHVTLEVSHVLKKPDDLAKLKPEVVLNVQPRPKGFSDQGGKGVWNLQLQRRDKELFVTKYEFITYGREWEKIKKALDELAAKTRTKE